MNIGPNVISLGGHNLGSLTLVQGHHKKSGNLSCVSFGEECIYMMEYYISLHSASILVYGTVLYDKICFFCHIAETRASLGRKKIWKKNILRGRLYSFHFC